MEVWELPARVFPKTDTETTVLVAKREYQANERPNAVLWRMLNRDRTKQLWKAQRDANANRTAQEDLFAQAQELTLQLDTAVYRAYDLPRDLQRDVAEYLKGDTRLRPSTSAAML